MPDITEQELQSLIKVGIAEAKLEILVDDFQRHKDLSERQLKDINLNISKIYDITRAMPGQVNACRDELEKDIKNSYMSKTAGELLEQRLDNSIRSIKLWIVSTVGGFTAAGLLLAYIFKLAGFHLN